MKKGIEDISALLKKDGWIKGSVSNCNGYCLLGAIFHVYKGIGENEQRKQAIRSISGSLLNNHPKYGDMLRFAYMGEMNDIHDRKMMIIKFNDAPETNLNDVMKALDDAIKTEK